VVVPEKMTEAVHRQTFELATEPVAGRPAPGGLDRHDDVPQLYRNPGRVLLTAQLLKVKAEHVGGPVVLAIPAIEVSHLLVVGEDQRGARARPAQGPERAANGSRHRRGIARGQQPPSTPMDQGGDRQRSQGRSGFGGRLECGWLASSRPPLPGPAVAREARS
jgi:hypothetical protein